MIASGKVNVRPLITHTFPLKDSVKAFETARNFSSELPDSSGAIKVIIKCNWNSNYDAYASHVNISYNLLSPNGSTTYWLELYNACRQLWQNNSLTSSTKGW